MARMSPTPHRPAQALVVMACLFAFLAATPTRAAESDRPDAAVTFDAQTKADIQAVISGQLAAFDKGDAKAAEDYAAPAIKDRFPDPAQFFAMVTSHYSALIHARDTQFTDVSGSLQEALQTMTLTGSDGIVWGVTYSLQKTDGGWRITGCAIAKDSRQQGI